MLDDEYDGFELSEPFDTGNISYMDADRAFVLGVEWERIRSLVESKKEIKDYPFHGSNRQAIESMMKRRRVQYEIEGLPENPDADGWLYLTVNYE